MRTNIEPVPRSSKNPDCLQPTYTRTRVVYSFFFLAPLTFAVPRRVFCLFLRCLPRFHHVSITLTAPKDTPQVRQGENRRTLLSAGLLDLCGLANTDQSVVGLKLLQGLWGVVDESETSCLSTAELSSQTENIDLVLVGLVEFGKLSSELVLGDVGTVGVEDITASALEYHSKLCHCIPLIIPSSRCFLRCSEQGADFGGPTYTTICLRPRRGLRMNLRVRRVTGCSRSAMFAGERIDLSENLPSMSRQRFGCWIELVDEGRRWLKGINSSCERVEFRYGKCL
jgi:hypothetical protein